MKTNIIYEIIINKIIYKTYDMYTKNNLEYYLVF